MTSIGPKDSIFSFTSDDIPFVDSTDLTARDNILKVAKAVFEQGKEVRDINPKSLIEILEKFNKAKEEHSAILYNHIDALRKDIVRYIETERGDAAFGTKDVDNSILQRIKFLEQIQLGPDARTEKRRGNKRYERIAFVQQMDCFCDITDEDAKKLLENKKYPVGSYLIYPFRNRWGGHLDNCYVLIYKDQEGKVSTMDFYCGSSKYDVEHGGMKSTPGLPNMNPLMTLKYFVGEENLSNPIKFNFEAIKKQINCHSNLTSDNINMLMMENLNKTILWYPRNIIGKGSLMAISMAPNSDGNYMSKTVFLTGSETMEELETIFGDKREVLGIIPEAPPAPFPKPKANP